LAPQVTNARQEDTRGPQFRKEVLFDFRINGLQF